MTKRNALQSVWQIFQTVVPEEQLERATPHLEILAIKKLEGEALLRALQQIEAALLFQSAEAYIDFCWEFLAGNVDIRNRYFIEMESYSQKLRNMEKRLIKRGDKDLLALFCFMKDTGVRLGDAVLLQEQNLSGKTLKMEIRKYRGNDYQYINGRYPVISDRTQKLLKADEKGYFFRQDQRYYLLRLSRYMKELDFRCHDIRHYCVSKDRYLTSQNMIFQP